MPQPELRPVPRSALRFAAEFAAAEVPQSQHDGTTLYPFEMLARTGGVAYHPFWGRCVHDFAGMVQPKPSISVDYCHNPSDVIGFADRIELRDNTLRLGGSMVSLKEGDRAYEVAGKRKAGVPYEASITTNWEGLQVEFLPEGYTAEVNGVPVEGPLNIFRSWELWGVATLPYGADANTSLQFGAGEPGEVSVSIFQKGDAPVSTKTADTPGKTGKDYLATFGAKGGVWYAEGKPFEDCFTQFAADMKAESEAKDTKITELSSQITQLSADLEQAKTEYAAELQKKEDEHTSQMTALKEAAAGSMGGTPLSTTPPTEPGKVPFQNTFSGLTDSQAKFAAALKLPGQG